MNCSPPGSSVRGISQARILEWVAISSPGIFPTHGSHPHLLHWQADPLTLSYLGSPILLLGALYLMDKQGKWASIHCLFGMLMKDILVKTVSSIGLRFQTARSLGYQI